MTGAFWSLYLPTLGILFLAAWSGQRLYVFVRDVLRHMRARRELLRVAAHAERQLQEIAARAEYERIMRLMKHHGLRSYTRFGPTSATTYVNADVDDPDEAKRIAVERALEFEPTKGIH